MTAGDRAWLRVMPIRRVGRLAALACVISVALSGTLAAAAPAAATLAASVRLLASIGCARVPEASGPDLVELQCADDRAYLLCAAMQAQDHRLDCAIDTAASKVDMRVDAAIVTKRPAFAVLAEAEPCVAWAYPDPGPDKRYHGGRCARGILAALHCTVPAGGGAACPAAALTACAALKAAGDVQACTPATSR